MKNNLRFLRHFIFPVVCLLFFFLSTKAYTEGTWTHIPEACGKQMEIVLCIEAGRDGSIWVSSDAGVLRYNNNSWFDESSHIGFADDITISPHGEVWFCGYNDSLVQYDGDNWHYYTHEGQTYGMNEIGIGTDNIVWCATDKGVVRFDGSIWELHTTEKGLMHNGASRISVSPDGVPWICYGGAFDNSGYYGVSWFNGETWETFDTNTGLPSNRIEDIAFGPDGSVYVSYGPVSSSIRGIVRYDGTKWEQITDTICGKMIFDEKGILWAIEHDPPNDKNYIVTYNGITWNRYSEIVCPEGVGIRPQGMMAYDFTNRIWVGTNKGVLMYSELMGIKDEYTINPQEYSVLSNYPNPFNLSTIINFYFHEIEYVTLTVYSITGSKAAVLVDTKMGAGTHSVAFDGSNLASGVYIARLETEHSVISRKMLLIK